MIVTAKDFDGNPLTDPNWMLSTGVFRTAERVNDETTVRLRVHEC